VDSCETVTSLTFNATNNSLEYTDENNVTNTVSIAGLISSVSDDNAAANVKVIATHTSGDGTTEEIEETVTSIIYNDTNSRIEYTDENGTVNNVDLTGLLSAASDENSATSTNLIATHTSGDGVTTNIEETVTSLSLNAFNELEYIDETGTTNQVDISGLVSDMTDENANTNVHTIATHTSGNGTTIDIDETVTALSYDDANTRIQYVDENGVTNNVDLTGLLSSATDNNSATNVKLIGTHTSGDGVTTNFEETVTSISYNTSTSQIEYTDENGTVNSVDMSDLASDMIDDNSNTNVQTIATHTSGDGITTAIEETITSLSDNGNGTYTFTSENGTTTTFDGEAETLTTISLAANNTSFDYYDENGNLTNVDMCTAVQNCETLTSLSFDTNTNTLTYVDEDGTSNNISLSSLVSTMTDLNSNTNVQVIAEHTSGSGITTNIEETITELVDNGDNTWTFTSEDGTETDINHKECFYPPSVPIDASSTGSFVLDMYANYNTQYGSPIMSSGGTIPVFAVNELDYHVLDYDTSVMTVTNVSTSGVLSYTIDSVPANNCTYINILFCEK
ncbi:MAG: hypothetical protein HKO66_01555, partial [Saprospiraceae bacterium]|nr:hypothetical protein [Saprospiraceae bacterium]